MKMKRSFGGKLFACFNLILMILIVFVTLYPFIHVVALSLSAEKYIFAGQVNLFPKGLTGYAYEMIFKMRCPAVSF